MGTPLGRCDRRAPVGPPLLGEIGRISAGPKTGDLMKRHEPNA